MIPRARLLNKDSELVIEAFGCEEVPEGFAFLGYYADQNVEPQELLWNNRAFQLTSTLPAGLWVEGLPPFNLDCPILLELL